MPYYATVKNWLGCVYYVHWTSANAFIQSSNVLNVSGITTYRCYITYYVCSIAVIISNDSTKRLTQIINSN